MRPRSLYLVSACLLPMAGCVDALLDGVDEPPEQDPFDGPQESVGGENETNEPAPTPPASTPPPAEPTPTPTPAPTAPSPAPTTTPPPEPTPTPTPEPTPAPTPAPTPTPSPTPNPTPTPTWPVEGSYVRFLIESADNVPNTYTNHSEAIATWIYTDGDWQGTCEGTWTLEWDEDSTNQDAQGTFSATFTANDPPHWPLFNTRDPPAVGQMVEAWTMWDCRIESRDYVFEGPTGQTEAHDANNHDVSTVPADAFRAVNTEEESPYHLFETEWDRTTGLVLHWEKQLRMSGTSGWLMETDADVR